MASTSVTKQPMAGASGSHAGAAAPGWWRRAMHDCFAGPWNGRAQRVAALTTLTLIVSLADLYLTLHYLTTVGMAEGNPIALWVIRANCPWVLVVFKLGLVAFTCGTLWLNRRRASAEIGAWVCCLVMAWLCWRWYDYTSTVAHVLASVPEVQNASTWVKID
jgi:hypothetical protein